MTEEFNSIEEIEKYYDKKLNAYVFKENGEYIDLVKFNFDLSVEADICAGDIDAYDIDAYDISSYNINAHNIYACNMNTWVIEAKNIEALDIDAWHIITAGNIAASNINAFDIEAKTILALDIDAWDIRALDITANNISYDALCSAQRKIRCKSINGRKENAKHFAFNGLEVIEEPAVVKEETSEEVKQTTTTTSVVVKSCDKV